MRLKKLTEYVLIGLGRSEDPLRRTGGRGIVVLLLGTPFRTYPIPPLGLDLKTGLGLSLPSLGEVTYPTLPSDTSDPPYSPTGPIPRPGDCKAPSPVVDVDAKLGAKEAFRACSHILLDAGICTLILAQEPLSRVAPTLGLDSVRECE